MNKLTKILFLSFYAVGYGVAVAIGKSEALGMPSLEELKILINGGCI